VPCAAGAGPASDVRNLLAAIAPICLLAVAALISRAVACGLSRSRPAVSSLI
jgi:hypothetical protein